MTSRIMRSTKSQVSEMKRGEVSQRLSALTKISSAHPWAFTNHFNTVHTVFPAAFSSLGFIYFQPSKSDARGRGSSNGYRAFPTHSWWSIHYPYVLINDRCQPRLMVEWVGDDPGQSQTSAGQMSSSLSVTPSYCQHWKERLLICFTYEL